MQFIGLIFLSGYNIRLSERDCWSTDRDFRCDTFCTAMSRNRFFEIKAVLHAANNQHLSDSRMAKVKPLYDILNKKLRRFGVVHEDLSIDDSRHWTTYYERHSCKQFIRGKPIRFGYKLWVLASSTGLPYHLKYTKENPQMQKTSLLGSELSKLHWKSAITQLNIVFSSTIFSQVIKCSLTWMLEDSEPLVP